jgi:hypothetical protein
VPPPRPAPLPTPAGWAAGCGHGLASPPYCHRRTWPQGWHTTPGRRVGIRHLAAGLAYDTRPQGWHTPGRRVGIRHLAAGLAYTWPQGRHTTPGPGLAYDTRPRVGIRHPAQGWHTPGRRVGIHPAGELAILYTLQVRYSLHFPSLLFFIFCNCLYLYTNSTSVLHPQGRAAGAGALWGGCKNVNKLVRLKV